MAVGRCDLSPARGALLFRNLGRPGPRRYPTVTKGHFRVSNLPTKVCLVKAMVFPVVVYGCESWTVKKAEPEELMLLNEPWCWRRLLRVPWTARRLVLGVLWKE